MRYSILYILGIALVVGAIFFGNYLLIKTKGQNQHLAKPLKFFLLKILKIKTLLL
jgi:hypothetical protein